MELLGLSLTFFDFRDGGVIADFLLMPFLTGGVEVGVVDFLAVAGVILFDFGDLDVWFYLRTRG